MRLHIEMQGKLADELTELINKYLNREFAALSIGEVVGVIEVQKHTIIAEAINDAE